MGFGGALIFSALARNLKARWPEKKIVLVHGTGWRRALLGQPHPDHAIYLGNTDIDAIIASPFWPSLRPFHSDKSTLVIDQRDPRFSYAKGDSKERIVYRTGRHAIQHFCDVFDIADAQLLPRIVLQAQEIQKVDRILEEAGLTGRPFLCIEPHSKQSFTPNKAWFWNRWQELAARLTRLSDPPRLVQIGGGEQYALDCAIDLSGRFSFRENARILERSLGLVSYMGGLVHLSKAVGRRNVVLISAWEPKELASYPDDINLYSVIECMNCGLKLPCPHDRECMRRIGVDVVFEACQQLIGTSAP